MIKKILVLLMMVTFMCLAQPVFAIDLQAAKDQGLVGEALTGYLQPVKAANPEVQALVDSINSQRKQQYKSIAQRNKTSLQAVEQLAGKKAMEKSKPGHFIKSGGSWVRK